jgi:predicted Fe-Mo cluster-binding NifX family protein
MSYKIAVTSSDGTNIDQHFGQALNFRIFLVDEETGEAAGLEIRAVKKTEAPPENDPPACGCGGHGRNEPYLEQVAAELGDCRYLLTAKIGPRPQAVLERHGLTALAHNGAINPAIDKLNRYHQRGGKNVG